MILKSITLNGFKSFGKKTTIDLSRNVTGVVGPNGSGKSNISEAIRFVMGEQSMKSIRSKSNADLIFKGSSHTSALSRATVSIEIDNKDKSNISGVSHDLAQFLVYDDITLSREVYADGGSVYKINNAEVRLKDVQEILAIAGIGASSHTIISQGEADQILIASKSHRKEIIEDALGLRVHHIRLKESYKKIKKVEENIKIVEIQRKEIAPEISYLKLQMEKIKRVEEEKVILMENYKKYLKIESKSIEENNDRIKNYKDSQSKINDLKSQIQNLVKKEEDLEVSFEKKDEGKETLQKEKFTFEKELINFSFEKKNLLQKISDAQKNIYIEHGEFKSMLKLFGILEKSIKDKNFENIESAFKNIQNQISKYGNSVDTTALENNIKEITQKETDIKENIKNIDIQIGNMRSAPNENIKYLQTIYKEKVELEQKINSIQSEEREHINFVQNMMRRESDFNFTLGEASRIVGQKVLDYKDFNFDEKGYSHEDIKRKIDRSKIRIEEIGIINGADIKGEFEEVLARDNFLESELRDLEGTRESVEKLIIELKETINKDFRDGLDKINFNFANLFNEIFPGGKAKIFVTEADNKIGDDEEDANDLQEDNVSEGVDIDISLPEKNVKDINMLSGGEKTLCSISLLFALTTILPPPFMVLDETDAALDESNAKKYGKLLQKLSKKSRLLVITHNRETMNECDTLYGVTMGGDGVSKVLSIKFD